MKKKINYFLAHLFITPLVFFFRLLPAFWINKISNFITFFLEKIIKYRSSVIDKNLSIAFSEKSSSEREIIKNNFYSYLVNYGLNLITDSKKDLQIFHSNLRVNNSTLLEKYYKNKEHLFFLSAHMGYWEYLGLFFKKPNTHYLNIVYRAFTNKYAKNILESIRYRKSSGTMIEDSSSVRKIITSIKTVEQPMIFTFLLDQAPNPKHSYVVNFFGKSTHFHKGPEELINRLDKPVLFFWIDFDKKHKSYILNIEPLKYNKKIKGDLTQQYAKSIEKYLLKHPGKYLWTHKRWKHDGIQY